MTQYTTYHTTQGTQFTVRQIYTWQRGSWITDDTTHNISHHTIPRHLLFQKLVSHNVTGKFYDSIKNMYTHDLACISLGDKMTQSFRINQGVKQGCILSPLLFNIFLSDLPDQLNNGDARPVRISETESLDSLIWADDLYLFILSETENGLNTML